MVDKGEMNGAETLRRAALAVDVATATLQQILSAVIHNLTVPFPKTDYAIGGECYGHVDFGVTYRFTVSKPGLILDMYYAAPSYRDGTIVILTPDGEISEYKLVYGHRPNENFIAELPLARGQRPTTTMTVAYVALAIEKLVRLSK